MTQRVKMGERRRRQMARWFADLRKVTTLRLPLPGFTLELTTPSPASIAALGNIMAAFARRALAESRRTAKSLTVVIDDPFKGVASGRATAGTSLHVEPSRRPRRPIDDSTPHKPADGLKINSYILRKLVGKMPD